MPASLGRRHHCSLPGWTNAERWGATSNLITATSTAKESGQYLLARLSEGGGTHHRRKQDVQVCHTKVIELYFPIVNGIQEAGHHRLPMGQQSHSRCTTIFCKSKQQVRNRLQVRYDSSQPQAAKGLRVSGTAQLATPSGKNTPQFT